MDHKQVEQLERRIEEELAAIMDDMNARHLPLVPSPRTLHLMAKAAVTVYEAAVDREPPPRKAGR
jgi:hypothetical protein